MFYIYNYIVIQLHVLFVMRVYYAKNNYIKYFNICCKY